MYSLTSEMEIMLQRWESNCISLVTDFAVNFTCYSKGLWFGRQINTMPAILNDIFSLAYSHVDLV